MSREHVRLDAATNPSAFKLSKKRIKGKRHQKFRSKSDHQIKRFVLKRDERRTDDLS